MLLGLGAGIVEFPHFCPFPGLGRESWETSWGLQRSQPMGQQPSPPLSLFFPVLGRVTAVTLHLLVMAVVQGPQPCL